MIGRQYDNELLVEFEFVVDLDLALYKFIKDNYSSSKYVNELFMKMNNEEAIIYNLLNRKNINPLNLIMPGYDVDGLYNEIMTNKYEDLLSYASTYDTFPLMVTFLKSASSVDLDIWCRSKLESDFIKSLNSKVDTIIVPKREDININKYSALYVKYIPSLNEYKNLNGKHIYIPAAKWNMDREKNIVSMECVPFSGTNVIHLIDLYKRVKFRYRKEDKK